MGRTKVAIQAGGRVIPLRLDVTNSEEVTAAAATASNVDLVINNASIARGGWLGDPSLVENARREMEVNYFGPLSERASVAARRLVWGKPHPVEAIWTLGW